MTPATIVAALGLPAESRVDQRVPKKMLVENGAPTATDKRYINDGVEELVWVAALKPSTIGVPEYRDDLREYLEVAVLTLVARAEAKIARLLELIHRAIPYPLLLVTAQPSGVLISQAHIRWSQGQSGETVLDGAIVTAEVNSGGSASDDLLRSFGLVHQSRQNLHSLYQGWIERLEAFAAAKLTGEFRVAESRDAAERRRVALADYERITREIGSLRARASKENQINRRVDINLQLKSQEALLVELARSL